MFVANASSYGVSDLPVYLAIINESTFNVRKPRKQIPSLPGIRRWYEEPTENHSQLS
jgi:hypothetical protein